MAANRTTSSGKVTYVPHPNPHPQAADAPRTGVPTNPVPPKQGGVSAKQWMKETD